MQKIANLHFRDHIVVVINGLAVQPQAHANTGLQHVIGRRDAVAHPEIAGGVMGHAGAALGEKFDVLFSRPHAVPDHHAWPEKSNVMHVLHQSFS